MKTPTAGYFDWAEVELNYLMFPRVSRGTWPISTWQFRLSNRHQEFLAAITLFLNFLAKSNGETCQSATNVALCGKWYLCWSAGGAHVCFWSNRGQFHISSVLSLPIFCPLHFSSPSPSSPSALFSFHVLRLPLAAVSPASLQFIRLYYQLFFPLFQPESIDCLLVPSANVGVPRWLPSRPFVILLGLTGLWPDMGYKSNQMFRGEDTEECVIHSVPTKVPQLFYRLILIRIVLLDFSVSKIKNNQSLLVKMGSLNHCFGNWSVIVRWSDSAAENKQHITMYNLKYLGHDLGAIVEKIWAWTQQPPRIPSQLRWFSASYLFVFSRWRVSFFFRAFIHLTVILSASFFMQMYLTGKAGRQQRTPQAKICILPQSDLFYIQTKKRAHKWQLLYSAQSAPVPRPTATLKCLWQNDSPDPTLLLTNSLLSLQ